VKEKEDKEGKKEGGGRGEEGVFGMRLEGKGGGGGGGGGKRRRVRRVRKRNGKEGGK
jgi:hypothetical protein